MLSNKPSIFHCQVKTERYSSKTLVWLFLREELYWNEVGLNPELLTQFVLCGFFLVKLWLNTVGICFVNTKGETFICIWAAKTEFSWATRYKKKCRKIKGKLLKELRNGCCWYLLILSFPFFFFLILGSSDLLLLICIYSTVTTYEMLWKAFL